MGGGAGGGPGLPQASLAESGAPAVGGGGGGLVVVVGWVGGGCGGAAEVYLPPYGGGGRRTVVVGTAGAVSPSERGLSPTRELADSSGHGAREKK